MTLGHDLVLALHFFGLFLGGASAFGLPVIGALTGRAPPEHRPTVGQAVKPLKALGHAGIGLLILTGIILAFQIDAWTGAPAWFWVKLTAVAGLVAGIVVAGRTGAKAMSGDAGAAARMPKLSALNIGLGVLIILSATLAFH